MGCCKKKSFLWLKATFFRSESEPEPVKKIPGAGHKLTGSTKLNCEPISGCKDQHEGVQHKV